MKKQRKLKKGLAILLTAAMVVGLMPGVGTMKVSAEETSTTASVTFSALYGNPEGYNTEYGDERYSNLLDGTATTKWCCSFEDGSAYVIFKASQLIYVDGYSVWTANDSGDENGARNPVAWTLSACNDYDETNKTGGTWQIIHRVEVTEDNSEDALPAANETEKKYSFTQTTDCYRYFKLNITRITSGETMQLGDFALSYTALTCEEHQWVVTKTIEPTCTKGGYTEETCSVCGQVRQSNPKDALGHDFVLERCTRCGKTMATAETPSVTAYATAEQLKNANNFTLHTVNGTGVAQKVNFGTNGTSAQTWYIAGYEDGTKSLVMMCNPEKPFATNKVFQWYTSNITSGIQGTYTDTAPSEVYANHYGCSVLRAYLTADALNNFSESEKTLMQNATVYTNDTKNGVTYSTADKLYAAYGNYHDNYITVGTNAADNLNNGIKIGLSSSNGPEGSPYTVEHTYTLGEVECRYSLWLRTPSSDMGEAALQAVTGDKARTYIHRSSVYNDDIDTCVVPAFHLNMSSVLFASGAPAGTSDASLSDAMTFRYNGTDKVTSTAVYEANGVKVTKGGDNEYLYIQWKENDTDKVYSKQITSDMNISRGSLGVDSFENCKIWIEKVEDNIAYAVEATKGHDYSAQIISDNAKISDATCTEKAKYYYSCSVCGEVEKNANHVFEYGELAKHTDENDDGICDSCAKRLFYLVYASSRLSGTSESVSNISMNPADGKVKAGESVTVTAQDMHGCEFKGWYLASAIDNDNNLVEGAQEQSTSFTYTFTPDADTSLVAVYEVKETNVTTIEGATTALQTAVLDRNSYIKLTLTGDALTGITADNMGVQGTALYTEAVKHIAAGEAGSSAKLGDYFAKTVDGYSLSSSATSNGSDLLSVTYTYHIDYYTDKTQEDTVDSRLSEIYASLQLSDSTLTDAQKVFKIYDWITNNVTYDYENLNDNTNKTKYTAYGALVDGKAVCQGFAGLFYRMCMDNGIDCRIVTGTASNGQSDGAHAWNIVKVGDAYYYVDATWDCKVLEDTENSRKAKPGKLYYFLRSSLDNHTESETENVTNRYSIAAESLAGIQIEVSADVTNDTISSSAVLKDICGATLTEEQLAWYQVTATQDTTNTCKWSVTVSPSAVGLESIVLAEKTVYIHGGAGESGNCTVCGETIDAYKHLQTLITSVNGIEQGDYSDASYQTLQNALAEAKALTDASTDEELTAAYEALTAAKNGLKNARTTVTTSSDPANSGILTGGGKYAAGETITLTAKAVSGYKFLGWYLNGTEAAVSTNTTYEVTVTESTAAELNYIAKYEANENKKLSVTVGNGTVAYSYQNGTQTGTWGNDFTDNSYAKGTYFTVTAQPTEGYTFLYWINSAGRVLTEAPTYSFYLGDDLKLQACYKTAVANQHYVIFKDMNGKVLWSGDVSMNQPEEGETTKYGTVDLPSHGIFAGYTFKQWKDASGNVISTAETGTVKITEDIVIYADYAAVTGLRLTVDGVLQDTTYAYASKVTVTADESKDNKYFSGWYIGEKLVSDSREYTFYITGDTSLTAKYEGESVIVQKPIVNMTMSERTTLENSKQTLVMNVNWSVPEGYTFVEGGLVRSLVDAYSDNLTLSDVDGTNVKKNVSKLTTAEGTYSYTLTLSTASVDKNVYAVGYITYKNDATGEVTTIYTDKFTSTAVSNGAGN